MALGLMLPDDEAAAPRARMPIDMARIVARDILAQRLELGPLAARGARANSQLIAERSMGERHSAAAALDAGGRIAMLPPRRDLQRECETDRFASATG